MSRFSTTLPLITGFAVLVTSLPACAQPPAGKDFDKTVISTLRDIHDRGADLYNLSKDYTSAYRLYEGSLLTVKPLLAHRPDVQKSIEDGLAAAGKEADVARKAFLLHETIEKVRTELKAPPPAPKPKESDPKPKEPMPKPKEPEPKPKPKEPEPKPKVEASTISGKVTIQGKPLVEGTVTFTSPDPKGKTAAAAINKDGSFALKDLPPGKYVVSVTSKTPGVVPAKFGTPETSGLTYTAAAGMNQFDIDLK